MLISFDVKNYQSIRESQGISFVASRLKDNPDGLLRHEAIRDTELLPAILVYGPNAAGKSNLLKSIKSMINTVLNSHTRGGPGSEIPTWHPFKLRRDTENQPTSYNMNFIVEDVHYRYGFSVSRNFIEEEWLFSFPYGTPRRLFERNKENFIFGRHLKGRNTAISEFTRNNSLFLSAAAQNDHDQLTSIYNFFSSIQIETSLSISAPNIVQKFKDEHNWNIDEDVIDFLKKINTGIVGFQVKKRQIPQEALDISKKLDVAVRSIFGDKESDFRITSSMDIDKIIELQHEGGRGKRAYLPIEMESSGTLRLMSALPKIFGALINGGIVAIDELDLSLHTQAAEALLELFCSSETNVKGAQLIASTHDTNLLQASFLRRDQVWFVEKNQSGETELYPLTDIKTRTTDNIERGYLQGRFGAVPR